MLTVHSSGAGSVGAHLLAYNGRDDGLFRGGIAESGSPVGFVPFTQILPTITWDRLYQSLTDGTGCSGRSAINTLECLRELPIRVLSDVVNSTMADSAAMYATGTLSMQSPRKNQCFYLGSYH